jgi:hypothetical protein
MEKGYYSTYVSLNASFLSTCKEGVSKGDFKKDNKFEIEMLCSIVNAGLLDLKE